MITGSFQQTVKDVYNGTYQGYNLVNGQGCALTTQLLGFTTSTGAATGTITRSYSSSFTDYANRDGSLYSPSFNVFENSRKISIYSNADAINDQGGRVISANYTLSSSAQGGLQFDSANAVYNYYSSYCGENIQVLARLSSIDQINFSVVSGDKFTFYGAGYSIQNCTKIVRDTSAGGLVLIQGCDSQAFFVNVSATRTTSNVTGFVSFNGQTYTSRTATMSQLFWDSPSTTTSTPVTTAAANAFCASEYHTPAALPGGTCIVPIFGGACVSSTTSATCCVNGGATTKNPTYVTKNGTIEFTFLSTQCVTLSFSSYYSSNLKIQNAAGVYVNPLFKMTSLYINTGLYRLCNALP